jgi:epoxyqueuosine reductase
MRNNIDMRFDVGQMVEGARSVVVCAVSYKSDISGGYSSTDKCKIAYYACNRDYHKTLKKMLKAMLRELQKTHPSLEGRAFVDSAPILEKQYAVEAGLGWIGRQSLLVTPEYGTYVLLGELVLNAEVDELDKPMEGVGCGECRRCMDACPTGAIVKPMTINTSRCISCHTIEAEPSAKINLNGWIFGCDECQNCCPYNKKAKPHSSAFNPLFDPREITAEQWMTMAEEEFAEKFGSTPLKRSGLERIKANIRRD